MQRHVRIHDRLIDLRRAVHVEFGQAAVAVDDVGDHQRGQRVDLAEAEGLAGEERLEEDLLEAVVGIGDAVDRLAAEVAARRPPGRSTES